MRAYWWFTAALLVACGSKDEDPDEELSPDLVMTDANNYGYTGTVDIGSIDVVAGADASVDWCALTTDIRGRSVDPNQVDRLVLIELELDHAQAEVAIETNALTQADTVTQWIFQNEDAQGCTASLSQFSILGNAFNPASFVETTNSWLLSATYFEDGRFDFVMSTFLVPVASGGSSSVAITDSAMTLDFDADLHTLTALRTASSYDAYTLDWSAVTKDVNGAEFDDERGNQVLIGKVPFDAIGDVENVFLRVDDEAEELYRLNEVDGVPVIYGETSADLMQATDEAGNAFGGFSTDGIWLIGIECTTCTSPAPLLLSVVEVPE